MSEDKPKKVFVVGMADHGNVDRVARMITQMEDSEVPITVEHKSLEDAKREGIVVNEPLTPIDLEHELIREDIHDIIPPKSGREKRRERRKKNRKKNKK